jgi:hypothetical protein
LAEHGDVEIHEQADWQPCELEIGDDLGFVHWKQPVDGFDFQHDLAFDDEIDTISAIEVDAFVVDRDLELTVNAHSPQGELVREALLVHCFEQAGAEVAMHLDTASNHPM